MRAHGEQMYGALIVLPTNRVERYMYEQLGARRAGPKIKFEKSASYKAGYVAGESVRLQKEVKNDGTV